MAARRAPARMPTQGRSPPTSAAEVHQHHQAAQAAQQSSSSSQQDALSVLLVTAGYDHTIRFWEAWSGICSRTIQHPDSQVNRLSISPDKRFLAAAANTHIRLYDCSIASPASIAAANAAAAGGVGSNAGGSGSGNIGAPAQPIATLEGHTGNVTGIAWHCDMQWLVSGGEDGLLKIWDLRTSRATRIYDHRGPVNDVVVHPNQGELVSCDQNGSVKVWDLGQNGCSHELVPEEGVPIRSVTVAADGSCLVAGNNTGKVYVWRFINGVYDAQQAGGGAAAGGPVAATAGGDFTELQPVTTFQAHEKYLTRVLLSPDVRHLATCSADATVKIWSTSRYEFALEKTLVGHQRWVWDAAFSADSAYLVTASSDHVARLWELASGETVRQYNGHHRAAVCVALNDASLGGP